MIYYIEKTRNGANIMQWTNEQEQAINENGSNILVAAAAGSGKTAVLVERIINKIINKKNLATPILPAR